MGFLDKMKSAVQDVSDSASKAIGDSKTDSKIRDEKRNIDKAYKEIGMLYVRCILSGEQFDPSIISGPYDTAVTGMRNVTELMASKGEVDPSDPYVLTSDPEPMQYAPQQQEVPEQQESPEQESPVEQTAPAAAGVVITSTTEEPRQPESPQQAYQQESKVQEEQPKEEAPVFTGSYSLPTSVNRSSGSAMPQAIGAAAFAAQPSMHESVQEPAEEAAQHTEPVEEAPQYAEPIEEAPQESEDSVPAPAPAGGSAMAENEALVGNFEYLVDAANAATGYCSAWYFQEDPSEYYDPQSLMKIAEVQEDSLDDDEHYVVIKDGSIGRVTGSSPPEWLFTPVLGQNREMVISILGDRDQSLIGYSGAIDDPEIVEAARKASNGELDGVGPVWYGEVVARTSDSQVVRRDWIEEENRYVEDRRNKFVVVVRNEEGVDFTKEEGDENPMYRWLRVGDKVRYLPAFGMFEKYDKSTDPKIVCMVCGHMNNVSPDIARCERCNMPLFK